MYKNKFKFKKGKGAKQMLKMKKTRILAIILSVAMIITASAMMFSCEKKAARTVLGTGATSFNLDITNDKGETKLYTIKTDETKVAAALQKADVNLIPADQTVDTFGSAGIVGGVKADFAANSSYWAFYIDGTMATDSAFNTDIVKDATYAFKYEKFVAETSAGDTSAADTTVA